MVLQIVKCFAGGGEGMGFDPFYLPRRCNMCVSPANMSTAPRRGVATRNSFFATRERVLAADSPKYHRSASEESPLQAENCWAIFSLKYPQIPLNTPLTYPYIPLYTQIGVTP